MAKAKSLDDASLRMALAGYEQERRRIEAAIAEVHARLGDSVPTTKAKATKISMGRKMSAAARKRIAMVQKKRWAAFRASKLKTETTTAEPTRKLSIPARKAIITAAKNRWKVFREAQTASVPGLPVTDEEPARKLGKPVRKDGKLVWFLR